VASQDPAFWPTCWWRNTATTCRCIARPRSTPGDGIDLDRSTLADWVGQTARLMRPLVDAVGTHVMAADRVHADDTTVPVLDPGRGRTKTGRLWCYVRDDQSFGGKAPPAVLYRYSPDRKAEHPHEHLAPFRGILQADGYAGYAGLYELGITEAACWAHARRKFFDVHKTTQSPLATEALQRIAALYGIEATVRGQPAEVRLAARRTKSAPLFAELKVWLEKTLARISGKSELAGAIRYTLSRCHAVTLSRDDAGATRWPCLHRQQRRRAIDAANVVWGEKTGCSPVRIPAESGRQQHTR
jgi:transposase